MSYPQVIHQPAFLYRGPWWDSQRIATLEPPEIRQSYVVRVPAFHPDGNEKGTLDLPAVTVPVGTYASWNLRNESVGAAGELLSLQGSYIPFAKTRAEQEANQDPRPSLDRLYPSYDDYEKRYLAAAQERISQGYMLPEELPRLKALCEKFRPLFGAGSR